jgi:HK97 family phage prohead protease
LSEPPNYRLAPDASRRCDNCKWFAPSFGASSPWCFRYAATVQADHLCDAWEVDESGWVKMSAATDTETPTVETESRSFRSGDLEVRETESPEVTISGLACRTGTAYDMAAYTEEVRPGAFTDTLKTPGLDCSLMINHLGLPLARTPDSLKLEETPEGLRFEAKCDRSDPDVASIASKIKRGLIKECSFAFRVVKDKFNEARDFRTIESLKIHRGDVSLVSLGASPTTTVSVRKQTCARCGGKRSITLPCPNCTESAGPLDNESIMSSSTDGGQALAAARADVREATTRALQRAEVNELMRRAGRTPAEAAEVTPTPPPRTRPQPPVGEAALFPW